MIQVLNFCRIEYWNWREVVESANIAFRSLKHKYVILSPIPTYYNLLHYDIKSRVFFQGCLVCNVSQRAIVYKVYDICQKTKRLCWSEKFRVGWTMFQLILTFYRCDCNQAVFRYLKIFDNSETQFNSGPEAKFTTKCVEVISIWTSAKYVKGGKG